VTVAPLTFEGKNQKAGRDLNKNYGQGDKKRIKSQAGRKGSTIAEWVIRTRIGEKNNPQSREK